MGLQLLAPIMADLVQLEELHRKIADCRVCEPIVPGFEKPLPMDRGIPGNVLIVGEGPGRTELGSQRAFAGQSGKTLDRWLIKCGANQANPREGIYMTSVLKCFCPSQKNFQRMAKNCIHFLHDQIINIQPALVITLGKQAFSALELFCLQALSALDFAGRNPAKSLIPEILRGSEGWG